jgi:hypothetical protein
MSANDRLGDLEQKVKNLEERLEGIEKRFENEESPIKKHLSIREFIIQKKPKSDVEKTLVIGYYLETSEKFKSFNSRDLQKGFAEAKEKPPGNISDKVANNVKNGHMMSTKEEKDDLTAYTLTNTGMELVERGFS